MMKNSDPLIIVLERALDCGTFIHYRATSDFIEGLGSVKSEIDNLVRNGEAKRAVKLYEIFMAGFDEKMDEVDGSDGSMGMFFEEIFCSWINARQKAELAPEETIRQVLKMMDNDNYGLCHDIEKNMIKALNKKEMIIFEKIIISRLEKALSLEKSADKKIINDFSYCVRQNADILKTMYVSRKNLTAYLLLCEKAGMTPKDCEAVANIHKSRKQWDKALHFVNKGLFLEKEMAWPNQSSFHLADLKREFLVKLGKKDEALQTAWEDFKEYSSEYAYKELMKYVPGKNKKQWHDKAVAEARKGGLSGFISICEMTEEWAVLAEHILHVGHHDLEDISHYTGEKVAKKLSKKHYAASAKTYRALGVRIVKNKKSKYYHKALEHLGQAKKMYQKADLDKEWAALVDNMRKEHYRKSGFIGGFEEIVTGAAKKCPSFLERTQKRWKKRIL